MEVKKLPFSSEVFKNADPIVASETYEDLVNVYIDELGGINRRPALYYTYSTPVSSVSGSTFSLLDEFCRGIYYWPVDGYVYFFPNRIRPLVSPKATRFREGGAVINSSYFTVTPEITAAYPYSFCHDGTYLLFACGGKIHSATTGRTFTAITDADAPTSVSHIAMMDGYLLANELNSNRFHWAATGTPLTWNAEYASAAGDPDNIVALHVLNREIFLFGARSFEIWENDGETPFIRKPGGFYQIGCIAPWSAVKYDNAIYWLTARKRFVKYSNGQFENISTPYDKVIDGMRVCSDCEGHVIVSQGRTFLVFCFPQAAKTLAYDLNTKRWAEWRFFNDGQVDGKQGWQYFDLRASHYIEPLGLMFVAEGWKNNISQIKSDQYYDYWYPDIATPIKHYALSGHVDHGTLSDKIGNKLTFRIRRGGYNAIWTDAGAKTGQTPQLMVRWKDNNNNWCREKLLSLGAVGDTVITRQLIGNGTYQTRQYEISATDSVSSVYVNVEEEFEVLG